MNPIARLLRTIGILAFILGIIGTIVPIFFPAVLTPIEPIICPEGTSVSTKTYSRPGESVTNLVCRNSDGIVIEDISAKLLIPIFIMIFGGGFLAKIASRSNKQTLGKLKLDQVGAHQTTERHTDSDVPFEDRDTLSEKLQQLQTALDTGLITPEEFERKRREIVDAF